MVCLYSYKRLNRGNTQPIEGANGNVYTERSAVSHLVCVFSFPLFAQDKDIKQNPDLEERLMCVTQHSGEMCPLKEVLHKCLCQSAIKFLFRSGGENKKLNFTFVPCCSRTGMPPYINSL